MKRYFFILLLSLTSLSLASLDRDLLNITESLDGIPRHRSIVDTIITTPGSGGGGGGGVNSVAYWNGSQMVWTDPNTLRIDTVTPGILVGGDITISSGSIISASGTIDFDDENLTTSGVISGGTLTDGTTTITGGDYDSSGNIVIGSYLSCLNFTDSSHYTGFPNRTDTSLGFNDATATFTLTATDDKIWIDGVQYNINTLEVILPSGQGAASALYHFWITAPGSTPQLNVDNSDPGYGTCRVALLYWNTTTNTGLLSEERHWFGVDRWWHESHHETVGSSYAFGLALTLPASGTSDDFQLESGEIYDEDIEHIISQQTMCTVLYHDGDADWAWVTNQAFAYKTDDDISTGTLQYNSGNTLTNTGNNKYVNYWMFVSSDVADMTHIIIGTAQHTLLTSARDETLPSLGALPSEEEKLIFKITYRNTGGTATFSEAVDFRTTSVTGDIFVPVTHTSLADLNWPISNHTGTAGTFAGFDAIGVATTYTESDYHTDTRGDARYYTQALLGSNSNAEGASLIGIEDAGTIITATDVEGALAENRTAIDLNTDKVTNANHSGEVTGSAGLTITDSVVDEANLKLDTGPTNNFVLTADSVASGGMKWAAASVGAGTNLSLGAIDGTTMVVASSTGDDVTLIEADTDDAGLLGAAKWDEIVVNTTHSGTTHDYAFISGNDGATDVTAAQLEELSDSSETSLHSHAGGYIQREWPENDVADWDLADHDGASNPDDTWNELDLGPDGLGVIPAGTKAVSLQLSTTHGTIARSLKLRKTGETEDINSARTLAVFSQVSGVTDYNSGVIGCDSGGSIDYYIPAGATAFSITVIGWWL